MKPGEARRFRQRCTTWGVPRGACRPPHAHFSAAYKAPSLMLSPQSRDAFAGLHCQHRPSWHKKGFANPLCQRSTLGMAMCPNRSSIMVDAGFDEQIACSLADDRGYTYLLVIEALGLGRTMFWNYLKRESLPRLVGLACQGVTLGQCVRNISVWHERHKHTLASGAAALGISRASYSKYLHMSPELVPRTVMLACAALDEGLEPIGAGAKL